MDGQENAYAMDTFFRKWGAVKPFDLSWQTIKKIQIAPHCKIGLGRQISVNFRVGSGDYSGDDISYDYERLMPPEGMKEDYFMRKHSEQFCELVCCKMCYYIKLVHNVEVIRMKADFLVDEFGKIWLADTRDAWVRKVNTDAKT